MENTSEKLVTLMHIVRAIHTSSDTSALVRLVADSSVSLMGAEGCRITTRNAAGDTQVGTGKPVEEIDVRTALFVPIRSGDDLLGALELYNCTTQERYTLADLRIFKAFADLCSAALTTARLTSDLKKTVADLEARNKEILAMRTHLMNSEKLSVMGEMAASFSHEIRNMITPIRLIVEDPPTPETLDAAAVASEYAIITEQIEKAMNMSTAFLSFSRQGHVEKSFLDLNQVVENSLELVRYQFKHSKIRLEKELANDLHIVSGVANQLEQVLVNLIKNAGDAIKEEGEIRLITECKGDRVIVRVRDTGSGMTPEVMAHIMEPFFTTKSEKSGTGLGLTICQRIVEQHDGQLKVESEVGKGTTFSIILPSAN